MRNDDAMDNFVRLVSLKVSSEYDIDDGADLCYNLVEMGRIDPSDGVDSAARIVAQHIQQA